MKLLLFFGREVKSRGLGRRPDLRTIVGRKWRADKQQVFINRGHK